MAVRVGSSLSNLYTMSIIQTGKLAHPMIRTPPPPDGVSIPFLRNSMVRRAFEFMRVYIHFSDNSSRTVPGVPLDKIKYFMSRCLGDDLHCLDFPKTEICWVAKFALRRKNTNIQNIVLLAFISKSRSLIK